MTEPGYIPGSVPPYTSDTASQLRNLEKRVDGLGRKDLSRANVGQGGRLRGLYGDGSEAILFGVDPDDGQSKSVIRTRDGVATLSVAPGNPAYGSKEQTAMRDINGKPTYSTDEVAGYGLSHPSFPYNIWGREELQPGASAGTSVIHAEGINYGYNPCIDVMIRVRLGHNIAGSSSISFYLEIVDGLSGALLHTSSTQTESQAGVVFTTRTFERFGIIPADYIGRRLTFRVRAYATTPSDWGVTMYPLQCAGISRAFYDYNPAFQ